MSFLGRLITCALISALCHAARINPRRSKVANESLQVDASFNSLVDLSFEDLEDDAEIDVLVDPEIAKGRHEYYRIWAQKAYKWVGLANRRLRAGRSLLIKWFRLQKFSESEIQNVEEQVKQRLSAMQRALANLYIRPGGKDCTVERKRGGGHGTLAYVYRGAMHGNAWVINVCDYANEFNGDTSTRTLVHEVSHHMGTDDYAYGKNACLKLPAKQAVQNADTYSLLVYQLLKHKKADGNFLYEEGSGVPHPFCNTDCDADKWFYDGGSGLDLSLPPPLGECLQCSWKPKAQGLAGYMNTWFMSQTTEGGGDDSCGDGEKIPMLIQEQNCEQKGCERISSHLDCLRASKALGGDFGEIVKGKKAYRTDAPYGCHVMADELFFNKAWRSTVEASREDAMICMCPTPEEFGNTFTSRACCIAYECGDPKKITRS